MKAILAAPVDLLWNGGIGTYVKAAGETHAEVGDKTNDAIRVNGATWRSRSSARAQPGPDPARPVEFARNGGRIFTDFIDNFGGRGLLDHEVNIKILARRRGHRR